MMAKPTLIYDGDCNFCQYCVDYLKKIILSEVKFIPYQQETLHLKAADCATSIHLVVSTDEVYTGAAAGFKTLSYGHSNRGWWLYQKLPGLAPISEKLYLWVTKHRSFCHRLAKIICGNPWQVGRLTVLFWSTIGILVIVGITFKNL